MTNFKIASILSKVTWSQAELQIIVEFLKSRSTNPSYQNDFFNYCNKWKLAPWVYTQLLNHNLLNNLSSTTIRAFKEAHEQIKNQNERRNSTALGFLELFVKHKIDVVILKGNLFAHTVYKDVGYKRMNDFDILIHEKDWERIQDIYYSLGYIPLGFGWSGEKQKAAKYSHVGMSFISPDFSCIIGSQWGLKSPTTNFKVNINEAWQTAKNFNFYGVPVKQLSPEYNLLHLILHMGIFKCGIRDCMDVYNYVCAEKINTHQFYEIIKNANASDKAFFTLSLSNLCSNSLDELVSGIDPDSNSFLVKRLNRRIEVHLNNGDFQDSYNDYFQDIEKIVIYFNLFPLFHKKIIFYFLIIKHIFFPKLEIALKLNDSSNKKGVITHIKSRIKAPYFVFSLIAQEIGWKFTFLLFLKLFIDLLLSLKNYVFKNESYFDYLRKKGIEPKSIEKAVKNIQ